MLGCTIQRGEQLTFDVEVVVELIVVSVSSEPQQHTDKQTDLHRDSETCFLSHLHFLLRQQFVGPFWNLTHDNSATLGIIVYIVYCNICRIF